MNPLRLFQARLFEAIEGLVPDPSPYASLVKPTQDPRHGDYQANAAMPLGKVLGIPPREVAARIVHRLNVSDLADPPAIAGPGFINLRLHTDWLAGQLRYIAVDDRLAIAPTEYPKTFVVDFSSPNVAKPMHVGHLRSTIIGAALTRLLRTLGHQVITDNHLGDWGTQFGILLYGYKHFRNEDALRRDPVREMARLYVHVRSLMKTDDDAEGSADPIAQAARQETAKLHAGDAENLRLWRMFMPWCLEEIERIYRRLDVRFDHTLGESFYQPMLPDIVRSLEEKGIAQPSRGALAIFFGDEEPPALVRKSDGAFTYTTTDLATIRYRITHWHPDSILYVVGAPQALHFKHLFEAARRWGYDQVSLEHIVFGSVLGPDRKPFRTREGGVVELESLLNEAVERANGVYELTRAERRARGEEVPELAAEERQALAEIVGLGAVKYADLSQNRTSDYVFSWDKMLAMEGNTATYMQYQYARIRSIFRKSNESEQAFRQAPPPLVLESAEERALAVQLVRYEEVLAQAAVEYKPHLIPAYLWDVAKSYSVFYQVCPVLRADSADRRRSRLALCDLTARTIQHGLGLLGIGTAERM